MVNNETLECLGVGAILGYCVSLSDGFEGYVPHTLIIDKIDDINKFNSRFEASRQAEKDGIKFINDIEGLEKGLYIDTKENREICLKALKESDKYNINRIIADDLKNNKNIKWWAMYFEYVTSLESK